MKKLLFLTFSYFFFLSNVNAQVLFGETIQTLEFRIQQDTQLISQLAARFEKADTSLTTKQLSLLYYGYALSDDFNPAIEGRILDAIYALGRREKYEDAINLTDNFLKRNPGCLSAVLEKAYASYLIADSLGTKRGYKRYHMLLDVPLGSGSGDKPENAFVITSMQDIKLVAEDKGYIVNKQSLIKKNDQNIYMVNCTSQEDATQKKTFYFNVIC